AVSLVRSGARVSSAASVAEAMVEAARRWPALLVSDIGMPGEDGISLIGRVRRLEATRGGPIHAVALTAYAGEDDRRRIIDAGYDLHVPKPVNTTTLISLLVRLVGGGSAARRPEGSKLSALFSKTRATSTPTIDARLFRRDGALPGRDSPFKPARAGARCPPPRAKLVRARPCGAVGALHGYCSPFRARRAI